MLPPTPPQTPEPVTPESRVTQESGVNLESRVNLESTKTLLPMTPPSSPPCKRPKISLTTKIFPTDQVFLLHVTTNQQCNAAATDKRKEPLRIPDEYKDLAEVFSEKKANTLPPHRGRLDHSITLEEGSKPAHGPIYNLSENELSVLKSYIEEYIKKGFIRPSTSPFGAPVLFVKKADGSL